MLFRSPVPTCRRGSAIQTVWYLRGASARCVRAGKVHALANGALDSETEPGFVLDLLGGVELSVDLENEVGEEGRLRSAEVVAAQRKISWLRRIEKGGSGRTIGCR